MGLGQFALRPNQQQPLDEHVSLSALQAELDQPDRANALLVAGTADAAPTAEDNKALQKSLRPTPADYGLLIRRTAGGYVNITCDRMILAPAIEESILRSLAKTGDTVQPARFSGQHDLRRGTRDSLFHGCGHRLRRRAAAGAISLHR